MTIIEFFKKQLAEEAITTHKMLAQIPDDRYDWQPHEKSMNIQTLANHIAELPTWIDMVLHTDELDFSNNPYSPTTFNKTEDLLEYFDRAVEDGKKQLATANDEMLPEKWVLRDGATIYDESTRGETLRMTFSQMIHHRAQLGVYLRMLNIPIPGSYGPSADEEVFSAETVG